MIDAVAQDPRPSTPPWQAGATAVAGAAGATLGAVFAVTARIRRSKPLHPNGSVASARLRVAPAPTRTGSPLLDEAGEHECLVRASYAVGTGPEALDIEGFAVRVLSETAAGSPVDLLFASTGTGGVTRYLLVPRPPGRHDAQTTLLPVRAPVGALVLRLVPLDPTADPWPSHYRLSWATGRGPWQDWAELDVSWGPGESDDRLERFDPISAPLPGTTQYQVVERLREPAYLLARRAWPSHRR